MPGFLQLNFPVKEMIAFIARENETFSFRLNWLDDVHIIGQLLKPHLTNTIFINYAARRSLVAEENSAIELLFSVIPYIFPYKGDILILTANDRWEGRGQSG